MPKTSAPVVTPGQGLFVKSQRLSPDQADLSNFGEVPSVDASMTLDFSVPSSDRMVNGAPAMLYNTTDGKAPNGNNGLGLRSDCLAPANCQAGQLTTAYNTTNFIAAEDFVPVATGNITTACLQGLFWNGTSDPSNLAGDCSDGSKVPGGLASENWTLTLYEDQVGDGVPDTQIGSLTFCTGTSCTQAALPSGSGWSDDPNVTDATKDFPTGNPDFAGIPLWRVTVEFDSGTFPTLNAGTCYFAEWAVANSDTTSGVFGCAFFHQAGVPGNGRAMQDAAFDGYDCCEIINEDLTICIDIALDNSAILLCDECALFPQFNEACVNGPTVLPGVPVIPDPDTSGGTSGAGGPNADLPDVPGLEGFDMSGTEGVWYKVVGNGNQYQLDFASDNMDTIIGVYRGVCDEGYYGVIGDDDTGGGVNGTDAQVLLESEDLVTYHIFLTSVFKCGTGQFGITDLGTPSTVPSDQGSPCALPDFGTATIVENTGAGMPGAVAEPCDDTGSTRINDGCNTTGLASDFTPLIDGDVIAGTSWQFAGTRDTDWFSFNVAAAGGAIVTWQVSAEYNFNIFLIDIGGNIAAADCANLTITSNAQALRCNTATISAVIQQGDYVAWHGSQEFDFGACAMTPGGFGPNTNFVAALSIAACTITDPGENLESEPCGTLFQNNEGCNQGIYNTTAITPGDGFWFGNSWATGGSRDTDFYSWTQGSAGEVAVTVQAEFPIVAIIIDFGVGGHIGGVGCPGTIVDVFASVACNQASFVSSTLVAGSDYSLFIGMGNLDGSGIFGGFPCNSGFNDYVMRVDDASSGACGAMGVVGACYSDCVSATENDCTSACGVYYGTGAACPATTCIADQTTQGKPAGDPLFGVPDGLVTGSDIQFYVNLFITFDCRADLTTTGAAIGVSGYGIRDGQVTASDIQFFVNAYNDGLNTGGASCNPGGPCTP